MGNVKFWDAKMGVQKESWKGHRSDVLELCVGDEGSTVFSTGVDQRTVEYRRVGVEGKTGRSERWVQSSGRRLHSHDVRALVVSPPWNPLATSTSTTKKDQVPILTSGGLDFSLITISCSSPEKGLRNPIVGEKGFSTEFENSLHRRAGYVRQREGVFDTATVGSGGDRLIIQRRERSVEIWKLESPSSVSSNGGGAVNKGWRVKSSYEMPNIGRDLESDEEDGDGEVNGSKGEEGWKSVLEMELKLQTNLTGMKVSKDGKWLVLSDLFETKLFKLSYVRFLPSHFCIS